MAQVQRANRAELRKLLFALFHRMASAETVSPHAIQRACHEGPLCFVHRTTGEDANLQEGLLSNVVTLAKTTFQENVIGLKPAMRMWKAIDGIENY